MVHPPMVFEEVVKDMHVYVRSPRPLILHCVEQEVRVGVVSSFQPSRVICARDSVAPHARGNERGRWARISCCLRSSLDPGEGGYVRRGWI